METIVLEAELRDYTEAVTTKNPFKAKGTSSKKKSLVLRKRSERRRVGVVQLIERKDDHETSYSLRFVDVHVVNERDWPLFVLLSRIHAPSLTDEAQIKSLETQGELIALDIGPDGQWCGAQLPSTFDQPLFLFDPLAYNSVVICKPSAARPPSVMPQIAAYGAFQTYMPPEKSPEQIQAEIDALAAKMQNTVMEMEQDAFQGDQVDLDVLQRNAKELFRLFDQDRSNSIDFDEYKQMLAYRGLNLLESKARRLFQLVDDQKKGYIDEREFVVALYVTNSLRTNKSSASSASDTVLSPVDVFYQLDRDRDEHLNLFEYDKAMQLLGVTADSTKLRAVIPKGAASISLDQFKDAWLQVIDVEHELRKRGISAHTHVQAVQPLTRHGLLASLPFSRHGKPNKETDRLRQVLIEAINKIEHEEQAQALKAKEEVIRIEKEHRDKEQEKRRALFAQQRQTETSTRTKEALRERQEKIDRRKERLIKERQLREEKRLQRQMAEEEEKREVHQRQVVHELMTSKVERIVRQKAKFGDDVLDLSHRQLEEIPTSVYKGRDAINTLSSLLVVNLSGNNLQSLPPAIFTHLFALQVLDLSDNKIAHVPSELGEARDLQVFDLRNNAVTGLPVEIQLLRQLRVINLAYNHLTCFGDTVTYVNYTPYRQSYCKGMESLEDVNLSANVELEAISEDIGELISLKVLRLRGNISLKKLPDGLQKLKNLAILDLSASEQKRIGKHVFGRGMSSLRSLNLSSNSYVTLPEAIGDIPNLQEFDISKNALLALSPSVPRLHDLVVLRSEKNKIASIPENIGELEALEDLSLARNQLASLPPTFGLLVSLQLLDLSHNRLQALPMEFGALINIRILDLSWNELALVPEEIGCLSALSRLDLSHNRLTKLPESIVLWERIGVLNCAHNAITTPICPSVRELRTLSYVDFSHNALTTLDSCFFELSRLEVLNLTSNHISLLPSNFVRAPAAASLRKLDLYHNRLVAIPVEWTTLLSQLDVFSVGRNPMTLLPEKWSDDWRLVDEYNAGMTHGYTTTEIKAWVHDQSTYYPTLISIWNQHGKTCQSSDEFVARVRSALDELTWQNRFERMIRHYYYEFKHVGHVNPITETAVETMDEYRVTESQLQEQREERALVAIESNNAFRKQQAEAYYVDQEELRHDAFERRRVHERTLLKQMRQETRQWNEIMSERYDPAEKLHHALVQARKVKFADEMKAAARERVRMKRPGQLQTLSRNDERAQAE
ncbi:hypothetical protein Poli38472_003600 [Pythium oligandrum]|uniref:EF-hand domain-containing protein n=1 Tax=Pythium oligandrum TaxID=41045 RepID=A0A8K1FJ94_PYTOL|nr:hypothetical protein Poli38472_003600 [Pythium oligandrum]|eukprot:TMW65835.1 hypothetical protein Poli38472_003600 [Pythium oligandrum]